MKDSGMYVFSDNPCRTAKPTERELTTSLTTPSFREFLFKIKYKVFYCIIQGYGRIIHANGDYYEGEVRNSKANG